MTSQHPDLVIRHIQTKNKVRKIVTYRSDDCALRVQHKIINAFLENRFVPSKFAKGYVKNRSIYHNAKAHLYNDYFVMLDIKDFFPHICHTQLADKLYREINLKQPNQISKKECADIVSACSISSRGLPLGLITSPILSNIYLKEFDCIFYGMLKKMDLNNVVFTRYADDLTISFKTDSNERVLPVVTDIVDLAASLLSRYGLQLNADKTRTYSLHVSNHVKITGINITKEASGYRHMTVGRKVKNSLFWEAVKSYGNHSADEIQHIKGMQSFILSVEKTGYESCYSPAMLAKVNELGFTSLRELIDSL